MKKQYKILLSVCAIEFFVLFILNKLNFSAQTWMGNGIGLILFLLPIQALLLMAGRDKDVGEIKRICFKLIFFLIIAIYLIAALVSLVYEYNGAPF